MSRSGAGDVDPGGLAQTHLKQLKSSSGCSQVFLSTLLSDHHQERRLHTLHLHHLHHLHHGEAGETPASYGVGLVVCKVCNVLMNTDLVSINISDFFQNQCAFNPKHEHVFLIISLQWRSVVFLKHSCTLLTSYERYSVSVLEKYCSDYGVFSISGDVCNNVIEEVSESLQTPH